MTTISLHNYQKRCINFIESHGNVYVAVDMGLGKTAIALHVIKNSKLPAIVFAPLQAALTTWPDEIRKWMPELSFTVLHGTSKDRRKNYDVQVYIIPYSSMKWFYNKIVNEQFRIRYYSLIIDEAAMIKDHSTQRFKMLKQLIQMFEHYRIALSALPSPNGYHELWSQYYMLDKGERLYSSYTKFRDTHFDYSGKPRYITKLKQGHDVQILDKVSDITFRLDAKDYLELPPIIYNKIEVTLPQGLMNQYRKLEKTFVLSLKDIDISAFSKSALSLKLRQFVQGAMYYNDGTDRKTEHIHKAKISALKELLNTYNNNGILCATQFQFEYDMITELFNWPIPIIAGRTTTSDKSKYIQQWNIGNLPLLICHPNSISHGVNLQSGGNIIVWYGLPWSLDVFKQFNGRLHRQGQQLAVVVNCIIVKGTIDEVVYKVLVKKNTVQQNFLDALRDYYSDY